LDSGKTLKYTAHTGLLPLYVNDTGERMASVFFIGYMADRAPNQPKRPITFLWNGGPGANSAQVHVLGFGPKRPQTPDTYPEYGPNTESPIVDHPETWLEHSDLVFVDPVGTGFSRATSEANRATLFTGHGDAEAVAEMIRVYLTRFDLWDAPLFVGGESYGTTRAMLVAAALERRRTHIKGVLLISGSYDAGQGVPQNLTDALAITEFTATAHYHKRLPSDLQALSVEQVLERSSDWARNTYAPALARAAQLTSEERTKLLAELARYTGVDSSRANAETLRLTRDAFADGLLADQGLELGRYDGRISRKARPAGQPWMPFGTPPDPSLSRTMDLLTGTSRVFNSYVRNVLGFESDLLYQGPFGGAFHPEPLAIDPRTGFAPDWMTARFKMNPEGQQQGEAPLHRAMTLNPNLRVINFKGLYDGSCALLDEAVARTEPDLKARVNNVCVPGGHMFYTDRAARQIAKRAFADFVRRASAPGESPTS
jgi:carboxypeptidase C (cathepsin A)